MKINKTKTPRQIILGTDWWTDCDDAVAIRLLARAHKSGKIKICAIGINACMPYSVASLAAFLKSEGLDNISIGIDKDATDFGGNPPYQKMLADLSEQQRNNSESEDAVALYRKFLSQAKEKVDLIEIGYPQVLANLLKSKKDSFSSADGMQLVKEKVNKLWIMAGNWENLSNGKENNFARNKRASVAANYLCENFPCEITFLGWETSDLILTGSKLDKNDVLYKVLECHGSENGRPSWDPMLCLLAVEGDEARAGYDVVCGKAFVDSETGINRFETDSCGKHKIVRKNKPDDYYKDKIDSIIS